jgi:hypothetical protein
MLKPKKFVTVDQGPTLDKELFRRAAEEAGLEFQFVLVNDLEIELQCIVTTSTTLMYRTHGLHQ